MLPAEPAPTRLDAEHYFALVERGELRPDDRVELLEGVVVSMPPQGSPHANAIARITALLVPLVGTRGVVRVHAPSAPATTTSPSPTSPWCRDRSSAGSTRTRARRCSS